MIYFDTNVSAGIEYCYKVEACKDGYCSSQTGPSCETLVNIPDDVTGLSYTFNNNDQPILSWNAVSNSTRYRIERQESGQNWGVIENNWTSGTSYTDTNVNPETTYNYRVKACNVNVCSNNYSNTITVTIPGVQPDIELTYPVGGETFQSGNTITITWNNINYNENVNIKYNITGTIEFAAMNIANTGSYDWTIPTVNQTYNNVEVIVVSPDGQVSGTSNTFTVEPNPNGLCYFSDIVGTDFDWANEAAVYLCQNDVLDDAIEDNDNLAQPGELLNRAVLAKMIFYANDFHLNATITNYIRYFPSPFYDLQDPNIWYHDFAKALSYLEYENDCVAVFDRNFFNFKPSNPIERRFVLKALLEAWDIDLITGNDLPFTDVDANDPFYDYIYTAWSQGIIQGDDGGGSHLFRPTEDAIRAEAFVMVYNMMVTHGLKLADVADFYTPGNYTPANMAAAGGMHSGNFNFYAKTSFAIPSVGMPLTYGHTYNSYLSDLPQEFFAIQPLGKGWSHSFNMYLMDIQGDVFDETPDNRIVILMPSGGLYVFKEENGTFITETEGVYATLTRVSTTVFQLLTKDQITYTFEKQAGTREDFPYNLVQIKDRNNNLIALNYETAVATDEVRLEEVVGTAGRKLQFYYHNNSDLLQRVNDPLNRNIYYNYAVQANGEEQLSVFINAKSDNTHYTYGTDECTANLLYSIQLPKGNTVSVDYFDKKMRSITTTGSTPTTYNYDFQYSNGGTSVEMTSMNDVAGNHTSTYNHLAQVTEMSGPTYTGSVSYHTPNQPTVPSSITLNQQTANYTYDPMGNVLEIGLPEGVTHQYSYTSLNDMETYTNPNNKVFNFGYTNGNLTSSSIPGRGTTQYSRNANGTLASITSPSNITVTYGYDNYGNVNSTTAPMDINTSATYDNASRLETATNPNGQVTSYNYDNNDNLLSHSFSGTTTYTYDENDNLLTIKNANDEITSMMYDQHLDFLKEVDFGGFKDTYTYYQDGRLQTQTDPNGNTFTYEYDAQKRLESIISSNDNLQYSYDAQNNIESVQNTNGTIQLGYDDLNRLTSTTDFYNNTVSYGYDPASNVTSMTYPDNKTVQYTYYDDNLLQSVKDWNNNTIATYTYRNDGLLETITYGNGTNCTYTYDDVGRNEGHIWMDNNDAIICSYERTFDKYGNITAETANEPLAAVIPPALDISASYDGVNRQDNFGSTNFTYADNGTVNTKANTTYTFDDYDRLTNLSGDSTFAYLYDGMGNRRQSIKNGYTTRYVLDINGMSQVLVETDENNNPRTYYIYGLGLAARIKSDGIIHYYHGDYRSSTVAMTDENGAISHKYAYGPYGEIWAAEEHDFNPFRYVGGQGVQYEMEELYFMRARYYDTETGRFLSEDPIWAVNLYGYASENPISNIDPKGTLDFSVAASDDYCKNVNLIDDGLLNNDQAEAFWLNLNSRSCFLEGTARMEVTFSGIKAKDIFGVDIGVLQGGAMAGLDNFSLKAEAGFNIFEAEVSSIDLSEWIGLEVYAKGGFGPSVGGTLGQDTSIKFFGSEVGVRFKRNENSWMEKVGDDLADTLWRRYGHHYR